MWRQVRDTDPSNSFTNGVPNRSFIISNCWTIFFPRKRGFPVKSSTKDVEFLWVLDPMIDISIFRKIIQPYPKQWNVAILTWTDQYRCWLLRIINNGKKKYLNNYLNQSNTYKLIPRWSYEPQNEGNWGEWKHCGRRETTKFA